MNGKNGNCGGPKVRDRLCQVIRQHQLDANLVKSYADDRAEYIFYDWNTPIQIEGSPAP